MVWVCEDLFMRLIFAEYTPVSVWVQCVDNRKSDFRSPNEVHRKDKTANDDF